ncbi:MAG: hypothetical protein KDA61_14095 [Planctomycetales bacterium]|nr:hypothetical protein [Planctomycetales bacterium]
MTKPLELAILPQPNDTTCGPTCLHAVYAYFDDALPLDQVIAEIPSLEGGGTLAAILGCHALRRGFRATIYTYNLRVFDPTWFDTTFASHEPDGSSGSKSTGREDLERRNARLIERIDAQLAVKSSPRLHAASQAYRDFLTLGGEVRMEDLNSALIRRYLNRDTPILTGLSATYLYRSMREIGADCRPDDIEGLPCGHFVVLAGYDKHSKLVDVADPYSANPLGDRHHYQVQLDRLVCAIMLGVLTYDANLLILEPRRKGSSVEPRRG